MLLRTHGHVLDDYPVTRCLLHALNIDMVNLTEISPNVVTANLDGVTRTYENPPLGP